MGTFNSGLRKLGPKPLLDPGAVNAGSHRISPSLGLRDSRPGVGLVVAVVPEAQTNDESRMMAHHRLLPTMRSQDLGEIRGFASWSGGAELSRT